MRSVLHVSTCLSLMKHDYVPLNYKEVFHMATLGGAKGKDRYYILETIVQKYIIIVQKYIFL